MTGKCGRILLPSVATHTILELILSEMKRLGDHHNERNLGIVFIGDCSFEFVAVSPAGKLHTYHRRYSSDLSTILQKIICCKD